MLKLKPSARPNRRYILIRGKRIAIEGAILEFIGVLGWAEAAPVFVSEVANEVTLAVNGKVIHKVRAALALAKDELTILRVSGTLKGLKR